MLLILLFGIKLLAQLIFLTTFLPCGCGSNCQHHLFFLVIQSFSDLPPEIML